MNMSYCRFQNTLSDLRDCADALGNLEGLDPAEMKAELGPEEYAAMERLVGLCETIAEFNEEF